MQQWPSSDVYLYSSPDRNTPNASQNGAPPPRAYHLAYDFLYHPQPYHSNEQFGDVSYTSSSFINPKEVEYALTEPKSTIEDVGSTARNTRQPYAHEEPKRKRNADDSEDDVCDSDTLAAGALIPPSGEWTLR